MKATIAPPWRTHLNAYILRGQGRGSSKPEFPSLNNLLYLFGILKFTRYFITVLLKAWSPEGSISITWKMLEMQILRPSESETWMLEVGSSAVCILASSSGNYAACSSLRSTAYQIIFLPCLTIFVEGGHYYHSYFPEELRL